MMATAISFAWISDRACIFHLGTPRLNRNAPIRALTHLVGHRPLQALLGFGASVDCVRVGGAFGSVCITCQYPAGDVLVFRPSSEAEIVSFEHRVHGTL